MLFLALLAATYTGNAACRPCHTALYDKYVASPMARTSGAVTSTPPGAAKGIRIDDKGRASSNVLERTLNYFIGSGAHGRSYLFQSDGFLFQAPVTWYTQKDKWDASPGYENDSSPRWSRAIEPNCLWCHASQPKPIYGTVNRYADPPFAQPGVGCERCHGPGSEHVQSKGPMVNPAKLPPVLRDSVCAQCHLSGEARIEKRDKRIAMYRPGDALSDYVSYFVAGDGAMKATSHYEKLAASGCKQSSGDKLWCGTCHSPHRDVSTREACLSCHVTTHCDKGPDCGSCHMPKRRVVDGGHGVLTDHSIPRRARATTTKMNWTLQAWPGYSGDDRELGLAYAEASLQTNDKRQQALAIQLLERVPDDADVLVRRAYLLERKNEVSQAADLYRKALATQPHAITALVNLGAIEARRGAFESAIVLWRRALAANPAQGEAGRNLSTLLKHLGLWEDAERIDKTLRSFGEAIP